MDMLDKKGVCQLELVYISKKGKKYVNKRPNPSPLAEKQMATIIHITIILACVLDKTVMNTILLSAPFMICPLVRMFCPLSSAAHLL